MKRILIATLLIVLLVSGCTQKEVMNKKNNGDITKSTDQSKEVKNPLKSESEQEQVIEEINRLLEKSPSEKEVIEFVDNNIEGLSKKNATKLVLEIENTIKANYNSRVDSFFEENLQELMMGELHYPFNIDDLDEIKTDKLKSFLEEIRNNGYKVVMEEGMFYPIPDYEKVKKYNEYLTDEIREYIKLMATETNEMATSDAALIISWNDILNRALEKEEFINKYPDSIRIDNIKEQYLFYVMSYIYGLNNTPAFDYMNSELDEELKESYLSLDLDNTDSKLIGIMKEYLTVLEKNNYKQTEEINEYRDKVFSDLQEELGISFYN